MASQEQVDEHQDSGEEWSAAQFKKPRIDASSDDYTDSDTSDATTDETDDDDDDEDSDHFGPSNTTRLRPNYGQHGASCDFGDENSSVRLQRKDYTVGWVCALPKEMAAARSMLDNVHEAILTPQNDSNSYTFGNIGNHNIVILCLPTGQYGTTSAAVAANNMERSFPSLQIRLMVGIGGGVPGKHDIRLGDVVVSTRVVPYLFGKTVRDGRFKHTGCLSKPPSKLLTVVSSLEADRLSLLNRMSTILARVGECDTSMRHPTEPDHLYDAEYDHHEGEESCTNCDSSRLIDRPSRPNKIPWIHYGVIASADQVMKHGMTRDRIAREHDVLCFEMEAAGLMDGFPCLVIRGICDYSDSHKAKQWQEYATVTAAAYARVLLSATEMGVKRAVSATSQIFSADKRRRRKEISESLKFNQIGTRHSTIKHALGQTCRWLADHPCYKDWQNPQKFTEHHGFLWISGKPGAGKSTIMKSAFDRACRASRKTAEETTVISFFFNARGENLEKTTLGMHRSLLHQLFQNLPDLEEVLDKAIPNPLSGDHPQPWKLRILKRLFRKAINKLGQRRLICFIDALDECAEDEVREMLSFFEDLGKHASHKGIQFYTCFSSRHYPHISLHKGIRFVLEEQTGHKNDMQEYMRQKLNHEAYDLDNSISVKLLQKASGIFMWLILVIEILNKEIDRGRLFKATLERIPSGLGELFEDILGRDDSNQIELRLSIQWILFSKRPLTPLEYYIALMLGLNNDGWDAVTLDGQHQTAIREDTLDRFVKSSSKGLAETTRSSENKTVHFIHESVRDFFLKSDGLGQFWPGTSENFESQTHDQLRQICFSYYKDITIDSSIFSGSLGPGSSTETATAHRQKVANRFPFLHYAASNVLHHANCAVSASPTKAFLLQFNVRLWIRIINLFHEPGRHQYSSETSLLYILAEQGLSYLVDLALQSDSNIDIFGEPHQSPLVAAIINGHDEASQVILRHVEGLRDHHNSQQAYGPEGSPLRRDFHQILNYVNDSGKSLIEIALRKNMIAVGDRLLRLRASDGRHGQNGFSILMSTIGVDGHFAMQLLLDHGYDPNSTDGRGWPVLLGTLNAGRPELARLLLNYGADPGITPIPGMSLLYIAADRREEYFARLLLEHGASVDTTTGSGHRPIDAAIARGHHGLINLLLDHGAHLDHETLRVAVAEGRWDIAKFQLYGGHWFDHSSINYIPLIMETIRADREDFLNILLDVGARLNNTTFRFAIQMGARSILDVHLIVDIGKVAIMEEVRIAWRKAIKKNDREHLDFLLDLLTASYFHDEDRGVLFVEAIGLASEAMIKVILLRSAIFHQVKYRSASLIHWCALQRYSAGINQQLIDQGFDINGKDSEGQTPLFYAAASGNQSFLNRLLEYGVNIDQESKDGKSALFLAVRNGRFGCMDILLNFGANVNHTDNSGQTVLFQFSSPKLRPIDGSAISRLVNEGIDINHRDKRGRTALHVLCDEQKLSGGVEKLVELGAEVDTKDNEGLTPLMSTSSNGAIVLVELLLRQGADPNATDHRGRTPLTMFVTSDRVVLWVGKRLVDHGANIAAKDADGETVVQLASRLGKKYLSSFLENEAAKWLRLRGVSGSHGSVLGPRLCIRQNDTLSVDSLFINLFQAPRRVEGSSDAFTKSLTEAHDHTGSLD